MAAHPTCSSTTPARPGPTSPSSSPRRSCHRRQRRPRTHLRPAAHRLPPARTRSHHRDPPQTRALLRLRRNARRSPRHRPPPRHLGSRGTAGHRQTGRPHALRRPAPRHRCLLPQPERLADAPAELHECYAAADLVIVKGDLNYRRVVGDAHHDPTTPFADACTSFPTRLLALRALTSDVIVGLNAQTLAAQNATNTAWRTNGSRAVIQSHGLEWVVARGAGELGCDEHGEPIIDPWRGRARGLAVRSSVRCAPRR